MRARASSFLLSVAAALLAAVASSCSVATTADGVGELPDKESFTKNGVSTFMEQRCGGLDCHGQDGRPLRIYSKWGLRLVASKDGTRSATGTTDEEQAQNYYSVAGLEPENLAACFASKGDKFDTFQLLKKPLDISGQGIRHKGGPVLQASQTDSGWQCLYGWASGKVDAKDCADGAKVQ